MSRESVPCVTRTFMCDSLRRSSSWLEMGSLETNFRICPCRNFLCTFSAMVELSLCTHLHNYARRFGSLSIYILEFVGGFSVRSNPAGIVYRGFLFFGGRRPGGAGWQAVLPQRDKGARRFHQRELAAGGVDILPARVTHERWHALAHEDALKLLDACRGRRAIRQVSG